MRVRTAFILVLLMLFLVVVAQNTEVVSVRLLFWDLAMSRIILLVLSLAVGLIVGFLLGRPWRRRARHEQPKPPVARGA
jgi:uncharacterized integral membrane protein